MSNSKHVPSFTLDVLCYLNRDQLERFSIACRHIKNFVERYFRSKPYRIFDRLQIFGGSYALVHNRVQWHPNRDDYSVQQFLARQKCSIDESKHYFDLFVDPLYYSFAEMRPYLGPTVRMDWTGINIFGDGTYNPERIKEMESIAYLSRNAINIYRDNTFDRRNGDADFQLILDSPTILQCRELVMDGVHFSLKRYKVLYTVDFIFIKFSNGEIELNYWLEFLEQPEAKPVFVFRGLRPETIENVLGRLSRVICKMFSDREISPTLYETNISPTGNYGVGKISVL
ncbi:hypothetical protein Ddc_21254 [Ditylenchus destructor]|nr:hypothetical protein Ddc_21254 [Ditylenchus destructor]